MQSLTSGLDQATDIESELRMCKVKLPTLWRELYDANICLAVPSPNQLIAGSTDGGSAGAIWDAGLLLAWWLVHRADRAAIHLSRQRVMKVLELGCGSGAAGLAAARCGAQVTLTDTAAGVHWADGNARRNCEALTEVGKCIESVQVWNRSVVRCDHALRRACNFNDIHADIDADMCAT
jgi:Lysine methyltransferase